MQEQYIHIYEDGNEFYYKDREMKIRHRLDGPAIKWSDGGKFWLVDDKFHRLDGPAVEWSDGDKEWYVDGKELTEEQFIALTAPLELTLEDIASKYGVDVSKVKIKA
jgi:hypothetical protein